MTPPLLRLSASGIDRFLTCPARYFLQLESKVRGPVPQATRRGGDAHTLIERHLKGNTPNFAEDAVAANQAAWDAYKRWELWNFGNDPIMGREFEVEKGIDVQLSEDVIGTGIADLIVKGDEDTYIYDWKTAWRAPPESEYADMTQPKMLGLLALCTYRTPFVHVTTVWPNSCAEYTTTFAMKEWQALAKWVLDIAAQIRATKIWKARGGSHCQWCSVSSICPIIERRPKNFNRMETLDEALRIAKEVMALKSSAGVRIEALKAWCETNGPITIDKKEYGYIPTKTGGKSRWNGP